MPLDLQQIEGIEGSLENLKASGPWRAVQAYLDSKVSEIEKSIFEQLVPGRNTPTYSAVDMLCEKRNNLLAFRGIADEMLNIVKSKVVEVGISGTSEMPEWFGVANLLDNA